jgi:hypothetical protein
MIFKRLFCRHKYEYFSTYFATDCGISVYLHFRVCKKCAKSKLIDIFNT